MLSWATLGLFSCLAGDSSHSISQSPCLLFFFFVQVLLYKGFLVQFCQRVFCNFSLGSGATALDGEFVFFFLATSKVFRIWRGTILRLLNQYMYILFFKGNLQWSS